MKKIIYLCMISLVLFSCNKTGLIVSISNPISVNRTGEMIELSLADIQAKLQVEDALFVITDEQKNEVPFQITFDNKVIFSVNVPADGDATYSISKGIPAIVPTVACGKHYPERVDDIAWENDLVAFRTYGPALQRSGERAFGYDVWTKRDTKEPVVEERYAKDLNPEIDYSYHRDYGNGLDCYKVGPTLGGGTAALMVDGNIIYPYCYKDYEILDNGPLRFSVKLTYNPLEVGKDADVIETRIISLDAGSHLNKTMITYSGLTETTDVAAGIVLHEPDGTASVVANAGDGYMSYIDPTDNPNAGNGEIFVGAAFPGKPKVIEPIYFSEAEKTERGADGHLLSISDYQPGNEYVYYWGSGWSKAGMTPTGWNEYLYNFAQRLDKPLVVAF